MKKARKKKSPSAQPEKPPKVEVIEPVRPPKRKRKTPGPSGPPEVSEKPKTASKLDLRPAVTTRERGLVPYDPLQMYLMEIKNFRLLTREEEIALSIRVREKKDQKAAYTLVTSNLRLVVKIAMDFHRYWTKSLLDLIQEGNVGLLQAVRKFDPYRGIKFSYYASFWIKAYMLKFIMENWKLVKIGTTQTQRKLFFNLAKERDKLISQGFDPEPPSPPPGSPRKAASLATPTRGVTSVLATRPIGIDRSMV